MSASAPVPATDAPVSADLVIAAPLCTHAAHVQQVAEAVRAATHGPGDGARTVVLLHPDTAGARSGDEVNDGNIAPSPHLVAGTLELPGRTPLVSEDPRDPLRALLALADRVKARAAVLMGGPPECITAEAVAAMLEPLGQTFDLALPRYARVRFAGLIDSGILAPLARTLYGTRIHGQLGVDVGFSGRFVTRLLQARTLARRGQPVSFVTEATCGRFQVCQVQMGVCTPPGEEPPDVSTALAQLLDPVYTDLADHAACWQRIRGSQPPATFGRAVHTPAEGRSVDPRPLFESFQLGYRNLRDVWGQVLPPATLMELNRLARSSPGTLALPDRTWARIVFDFALGHRLRVMNRDHLLRALTPIYLAWVAAFVADVQQADQAEVDARLEQLGRAYESEKPYLLGRWRWPDRFTP